MNQMKFDLNSWLVFYLNRLSTRVIILVNLNCRILNFFYFFNFLMFIALESVVVFFLRRMLPYKFLDSLFINYLFINIKLCSILHFKALLSPLLFVTFFFENSLFVSKNCRFGNFLQLYPNQIETGLVSSDSSSNS